MQQQIRVRSKAASAADSNDAQRRLKNENAMKDPPQEQKREDPPPEKKIDICHATNSDKNPYNLINVAERYVLSIS